MSKQHKIIAHLTFWIISITMSVCVWGMPFYKEGQMWNFLKGAMLTHGSTILYFYINYSLLVPYLLIKRRYLLFGILTLISFALHILTCAYLWYNTFSWSFFYDHKFGPMTYECIFYFMVSSGLRVVESWLESEQKRQQLDKELRETELLFLQSQMSPHFLFNTLNNIYGLSLNNSALTGKAVNQLKDLMRYFQYMEKGSKVSLAKELECLDGFIALHKLRNTVNVVFSRTIHAPVQSTYIDPMLLLPFVENAFKHGDLNKNISIDLLVDKQQVCFEVKNSTSPNKRKDAVGGIGIKNIERRLELLYPKRHLIEVGEVDGTFRLHLKISLHEQTN